jgi:hypothetical protein
MVVLTPSLDDASPIDQLTPILERCVTRAQIDTPAQKQAYLTSCKLDLSAIQEVEAMEGYTTDEDFDELLLMPKVQDFLARSQRDEQTSKTFWLLLRMRYLGMLQRPQRARVMKFNDQFRYQPAALIAEFYHLTAIPERLRFLSHLSYFDFAAFLTKFDERALTLDADNSASQRTIAESQPNTKTRRPVHSAFLAR